MRSDHPKVLTLFEDLFADTLGSPVVEDFELLVEWSHERHLLRAVHPSAPAQLKLPLVDIWLRFLQLPLTPNHLEVLLGHLPRALHAEPMDLALERIYFLAEPITRVWLVQAAWGASPTAWTRPRVLSASDRIAFELMDHLGLHAQGQAPTVLWLLTNLAGCPDAVLDVFKRLACDYVARLGDDQPELEDELAVCLRVAWAL